MHSYMRKIYFIVTTYAETPMAYSQCYILDALYLSFPELLSDIIANVRVARPIG